MSTVDQRVNLESDTLATLVGEVMRPDGVMAGAAELQRLALRWGLPMVALDDLRAHL